MPTESQLKRRRHVVKADLLMKAEIEDWHGVADAAMDLREVDAMLAIIKQSSFNEWFMDPKPPFAQAIHVCQFVYIPNQDHYACTCGNVKTNIKVLGSTARK